MVCFSDSHFVGAEETSLEHLFDSFNLVGIEFVEGVSFGVLEIDSLGLKIEERGGSFFDPGGV